MKSMRKKSWLKITLCVLVACAIVGTIISGIMFTSNKGKASASATIEFSFDGAADGIAPNGAVFSMDSIASDEVLSQALADAGMADKYTTDALKPYLKTTGVYPENIVEQMTSYDSLLDFNASREVMAKVYHPTLYSVVLQNGFDAGISQADLEKLLQCILAAFRSDFEVRYAVGTQPVELQFSLDQYDYPQRLTLLRQSLQESADYATELYEKHPTLRKGGVGFNDIAVKLNNLIDTDLAKLDASVTINALTQDKDRLISQYEYNMKSLENELEKRNQQWESITKLIEEYKQDEEMYLSTADGATQIKSNTSETYEKLQQSLEAVNDRMITIKSSIQHYKELLRDLGEETDTTEELSLPFVSSTTSTQSTKVEIGGNTDSVDTVKTPETDEPVNSAETVTENAVVSQEEYDKYIADLETAIDTLLARREEIMKTFSELIALYNAEQINDLTVVVSKIKYDVPKLLSGGFAKQTIKVAGPICAVGFMVCLVLLIISRHREEKLADAK